MRDYFEVAEIHVAPDQQGRGSGGCALAAALAGTRRQRDAVDAGGRRRGEQRLLLYRSMGFRDELRHFRFDGDVPFAVLSVPPLPGMVGRPPLNDPGDRLGIVGSDRPPPMKIIRVELPGPSGR